MKSSILSTTCVAWASPDSSKSLGRRAVSERPSKGIVANRLAVALSADDQAKVRLAPSEENASSQGTNSQRNQLLGSLRLGDNPSTVICAGKGAFAARAIVDAIVAATDVLEKTFVLIDLALTL